MADVAIALAEQRIEEVETRPLRAAVKLLLDLVWARACLADDIHDFGRLDRPHHYIAGLVLTVLILLVLPPVLEKVLGEERTRDVWAVTLGVVMLLLALVLNAFYSSCRMCLV